MNKKPLLWFCGHKYICIRYQPIFLFFPKKETVRAEK